MVVDLPDTERPCIYSTWKSPKKDVIFFSLGLRTPLPEETAKQLFQYDSEGFVLRYVESVEEPVHLVGDLRIGIRASGFEHLLWIRLEDVEVVLEGNCLTVCKGKTNGTQRRT